MFRDVEGAGCGFLGSEGNNAHPSAPKLNIMQLEGLEVSKQINR